MAVWKKKMKDKKDCATWVQFDGETGEIKHSKNISRVLKVGVGRYIINPTDEDIEKHENDWDTTFFKD